MKNFWPKVLLITSLSIPASHAASTIDWYFGQLYADSAIPGNEFADTGTAVYLFVSKTGAATDMSGLVTSLVGVNLNVGSTFDAGNDKVVVDVSTPNILTGIGQGGGNDSLSLDYDPIIPGVTLGDAFGILFMNQADGVISVGTKFGLYTSSTTVPVDPSAGYNVDMTEVKHGGPVTNNSLFTTHITAIPEPTTALLAAFGSLALLRRRRN